MPQSPGHYQRCYEVADGQEKADQGIDERRCLPFMVLMITMMILMMIMMMVMLTMILMMVMMMMMMVMMMLLLLMKYL